MNLFLSEQAWWDKRQFDPPTGYTELSTGDKKVRHIFEHTGKAIGKLAIGSVNQIKAEVIPDLSIYRSQLINLFEINPDLVVNDCAPGIDSPIKSIALALYSLGKYIEPLEHAELTSSKYINMASRYLHTAVIDLAEQYDVDTEHAHKFRLEQQLGYELPVDL